MTDAVDIRERPILFRGRLVRAILNGRKTVTRRVVNFKFAPKCAKDCDGVLQSLAFKNRGFDGPNEYLSVPCKDGAAQRFYAPWGVGDQLWVRETWCLADPEGDSPPPDGRPSSPLKRWCYYAATEPGVEHSDGTNRSPWRPSIHMPRWASRLQLEVTGVRVERLQEISEEDAEAEGVAFAGGYWLGGPHPIKGTPKIYSTARDAFASLWDSINGERAPWKSNDWVWRIAFRKVT
jgi:hypothetical protein